MNEAVREATLEAEAKWSARVEELQVCCVTAIGATFGLKVITVGREHALAAIDAAFWPSQQEHLCTV